MSRTLAIIIAAAMAVGALARPQRLAFADSSDTKMFFKKSEQVSPVNLADVATVQLATGFQPIGPGSISTKTTRGFNPASLEFYPNDQLITFRFEKDQKRNMGGYTEDPILMNVTLFNAALSDAETMRISGTTIAKFYPPVDDVPRKSAHFEAQRWLPDTRVGTAVTRVAETNQGRGDNLVSAPPARWLVIHVDPVRKVRVDLYAWQKKYSLDEARTLVQKTAESVQKTPKLAELFASVKTVDARVASKHMTAVASTITKLKPCGITTLKPNETVFSGECGAWMSESQRYIHVARSIGRVPRPAATRKGSNVPDFNVVPMPPGKPAELIGEPDFQLVMFYWDAAKNKWSIEELNSTMYDEEPRLSPLVTAIGSRLVDHASVYVVSLARYDLQFHADRTAVAEFLSESQRVATALRAGKVISGVLATPYTFAR